MYKHISDKFLFEYNMVHSTRNKNVFTTEPFFLGEDYVDYLRYYSEEVNKIVDKVMSNINSTFSDFRDLIPEFPLKDRVLNLKCNMSPLLWTRFDSFLRDSEEGIFFAELNYDKPCAEREIAIMEDSYTDSNNINNGFKREFTEYVHKLCRDFKGTDSKINIGFLTATTKREETHLGMVVKDLVDTDKIEVISVGVNNLFVEEDTMYAFDKSTQIDVLIRLFPTEHLHEIQNIEKILDLYENGKILLLNDPRVIIGQCKSLYTYLWDLIISNDKRLSKHEVDIIRKVFPYTQKLDEKLLEEASQNKDKYVLKPVFGRYSTDVFIGVLYTQEEWVECIQYVKESMQEKEYIIQEFCKIRKDNAPYYDGVFTTQRNAYANLGTFLTGEKLIGTCVRWTESYLTCEDDTWISPIVSQKKEISITKHNDIPIKEVYTKSVIDYGFSGGYTEHFRYLNQSTVEISENKFKELKTITKELNNVFKKTQDLIVNNFDVYKDILAIEGQESLISNMYNNLYFIGRLDFVLDTKNEWKVLEINAETPAGICESTCIDNLILGYIKSYSDNNYINKDLGDKILDNAKTIIKEYEKITGADIKTIACVGTSYYEDIYTFNAVKDILTQLKGIKIVSGCIYDMKVVDGKAYLYGEEVDCVYRYYPLDWIGVESNGLKDIEKLMGNNKLLSLNNANTIISQSKGFFAVIFELLKYNFYTDNEKKLILKHIPYTTFDLEAISRRTSDFLAKPLLEREGKGIIVSSKLTAEPDGEYVFQELCHIQSLYADIIDYKREAYKENVYPIFGVYVTDTKFAGMFTRLGSLITDSICMYCPTVIREEGK